MSNESGSAKSWNQQMLEALTEVQLRFLGEDNIRVAFDDMLSRLLELTQSEYGFIGEVLYRDDHPYLKTYSISNIAWDEATRSFYQQNAPSGMEFYNLDTLFGCVMVTHEVVISNDPATDPRRGGLPEGHPPLDAFLGIPLKSRDRLVGMVGIANRPGGYDRELCDRLRPFFATATALIVEARARRERSAALQSLEQGREKLDSIFETMVEGMIVIDYRGVIQDINPAACRLFQYAASDLVGNNVGMLMPLDQAEHHGGYIRRYIATGERRVIGIGREVQGQRRDGTRFPAGLSISEFTQGGRRFFVGTLQDLSERKEYERRLEAVNTELEAANASLEQMARVDAVTGLLNRRAFDEALDRETRRSNRSSLPLTLLMWDVDRFKDYNDTYGHLQGDRALRLCAQELSRSLKRAGDGAYRYGGEEFAAILPNTSLEGARVLAETVRERIAGLCIEHRASEAGLLTISCGVATCVGFRTSSSVAADLVALADTMLYSAKGAGRNRVEAATLSSEPEGGSDGG
jgi:diguanylate cyclase (GGDEF)-like protein/PAS domain S-box-containing protein